MPQRARVAVAKPLLDLAMPDAVRRVTRAQFDRWCVQGRELVAGTDPDALHDYRTAVRRLRTLFRVLRPWLPDLSKGSRRRLRALMQSTGPARNLEVLLGWIEKHRLSLTPRQRIGARWLSRRIGTRLTRLHRDLKRQLARKGAKLEQRLRDEVFGSLRVDRGAPPSAVALRRLLREETVVLNRRLGEITSLGDREVIHAARIAAKRVRYLAEPFAIELPEGTALVQRLRELQDLIGGITDVHAAADELRGTQAPARAKPGVSALARILRKEGDQQFQELENWLRAPRAAMMGLLRKAGTVSRGGRI